MLLSIVLTPIDITLEGKRLEQSESNIDTRYTVQPMNNSLSIAFICIMQCARKIVGYTLDEVMGHNLV